MKLTIEITMDNAVFDSLWIDQDQTELDTLLHIVASRVASEQDSGSVIDSNGNTVGRFTVTED